MVPGLSGRLTLLLVVVERGWLGDWLVGCVCG